MKKNASASVLLLLALMLTPLVADAALDSSYVYTGYGNWSIDAVGSNDTPVGTVQAAVPEGSTVEKAYLYSTEVPSTSLDSVTFEGTSYSSSLFTDLGTNPYGLQSYRLDVTSQVSSLIGTGSSAIYDFTVNSESPNSGIDGEALVVVYSNPLESFRTIGLLDGFSPASGNTTTVFFGDPLDPTLPGFEFLLSLGIGYGFQGNQYSTVDINGERLTSAAGGQDDGGGFNGGLITFGGIGDDPALPVDPYAIANGDPFFDDEYYNLALGDFLGIGDTSMTVYTSNPSTDDNIFFLGINVTALAGIDEEIKPVPEPSTFILLGSGLAGLFMVSRRKKKQQF